MSTDFRTQALLRGNVEKSSTICESQTLNGGFKVMTKLVLKFLGSCFKCSLRKTVEPQFNILSDKKAPKEN